MNIHKPLDIRWDQVPERSILCLLLSAKHLYELISLLCEFLGRPNLFPLFSEHKEEKISQKIILLFAVEWILGHIVFFLTVFDFVCNSFCGKNKKQTPNNFNLSHNFSKFQTDTLFLVCIFNFLSNYNRIYDIVTLTVTVILNIAISDFCFCWRNLCFTNIYFCLKSYIFNQNEFAHVSYWYAWYFVWQLL